MPGTPLPTVGGDIDAWGTELNTILATVYDVATGTIRAHSHAGKWERSVSFPSPVTGDHATLARVNDSVFTITVWAQRTSGGTGATIDVLLNGVSILTTPLSLTSAGSWMAASISGSPAFAAGDTLLLRCTTVTGTPDEIVIVVDGATLIT